MPEIKLKLFGSESIFKFGNKRELVIRSDEN